MNHASPHPRQSANIGEIWRYTSRDEDRRVRVIDITDDGYARVRPVDPHGRLIPGGRETLIRLDKHGRPGRYRFDQPAPGAPVPDSVEVRGVWLLQQRLNRDIMLQVIVELADGRQKVAVSEIASYSPVRHYATADDILKANDTKVPDPQ